MLRSARALRWRPLSSTAYPSMSKLNGSDAHGTRRPRAYAYAQHRDLNESKHRTEHLPKSHRLKDGRPVITVVGVGGAGSNAVNNMISSQLEGVEFVVANTDCQALARSLARRKVTLGKDITKGLGAGSKPNLGKSAAESSRDEIMAHLDGSNMIFITGGMGGGTCTGAAPVIASVAREMGILTVGVVSTPFRSEGPNRSRLALAGVQALAAAVDTLIVVPNQNLLALSTPDTTIVDAFRYADAVLLEGVKGVTDLIVKPGLINLDFADINTILSKAGRAMMGSGQATGDDRAQVAANAALNNPLLGELPMDSASGLLVTIRGGEDMTLFEVDAIMSIIRGCVSETANIIFGTCYDPSSEGAIHVSIIVSGIKTDNWSPPAGKGSVPKQQQPRVSSGDAEPAKPTKEDAPGFLSKFFQL